MLPEQYSPDECRETPNHYGRPVVLPEYFVGLHDVALVPVSAGSPPVCTCGWTRERDGRGGWIELHQHLAEMYPWAPESYRPGVVS